MPEKLSEHLHQCKVIEWARREVQTGRWPELDLLYSIPNGGLRNAREAAALKREGVRAGIPDLHLPVAARGYHSLYVEMKKEGGKLSADQRKVIKVLEEQGNKVAVCYSWEEAIDWIAWYVSAGGLVGPR